MEENEPLRPGFKGNIRPNIVTREPESYITLRSRLMYLAKSYAVTLSFLALLVIAIASVTTFRVVLLTTKDAIGGSMGASVLPSILSTVVTLLFGALYKKLAVVLTDIENHRTQTLYNDNLITKVFLFQFVNTFAPLFYLAFFRNGFDGTGLELWGNEDLVDSCPEGVTCMGSLTIQVASNLVVGPLLKQVKALFSILARKFDETLRTKDKLPPKMWFARQFEGDAGPIGFDATTYLYLDKIIAYALVTMFAAAFPLAPLVVYILSYFETGQMASELEHGRRPVAYRAEDIGCWQGILVAVNLAAVLNNALLLAFTSDFGAKLDGQLGVGARIWFIIGFEHLAYGLKWVINTVIDDIPDSTQAKMKAEKMLVGRHAKPKKKDIVLSTSLLRTLNINDTSLDSDSQA